MSVGIGTTETTVLATNALAKTTVLGLSLTNVTNAVVLVTCRLEDTVASKITYFIKEAILPANQSMRLVTNGEKLILGPTTNIKVTSNMASSVDVVVSYVEIV